MTLMRYHKTYFLYPPPEGCLKGGLGIDFWDFLGNSSEKFSFVWTVAVRVVNVPPAEPTPSCGHPSEGGEFYTVGFQLNHSLLRNLPISFPLLRRGA